MTPHEGPNRKEIHARGVPAPRGHFAHAVRTHDTVYVSGLLALDAAGAIVAPDDAAAQTEHILRALDEILAGARSAKANVVKLTIYLTHMADRVAVGDARARYFGDTRPASTMIEVSALAAAGARVEIDAIAITG